MSASRGQLVEIQLDSARWTPAFVTEVVSGDTVHLLAMSDGNNQPLVQVFRSVAKGSTLGTWRDLAVPTFASDAVQVVAAAGTDQTALGLDTARLPSATRPTRVTASGYFQIVADASDLDGTVELLADAANPPTTQMGVQTARVNAAAGTFRIPWTVTYDVPAGHRYKIAKTVEAGVTCVLSKIIETAG